MKAQSQTTKDIITFQFIADALGLPLNTVVKYFIFIIIIVFDPLAVGLVLAYNTAIYKVEEDEVKKKYEPTPIVDVPIKITPPAPAPSSAAIEEPRVTIPPSESQLEVLRKAYKKFKTKEVEPEPAPIVEDSIDDLPISADLNEEDRINREKEEYIRRSHMIEQLKDGTNTEPISADDMDKIRKQ